MVNVWHFGQRRSPSDFRVRGFFVPGMRGAEGQIRDPTSPSVVSYLVAYPLVFRTPFRMYAYLRTQEDRGPSFQNAKGMLLYPNVGSGLSELIEIQGHEIRIETIDLADEWELIESNLLALVQI